MTNKIKTGIEGEKAAAEYLVKKGYEILERNYRYRKSEIDLIVKQDNWLVFVEVKTRSSTYFGHPEEFVDREKERLIFEGADNYMYKKNWQGNVRYDIVAVTIARGEMEINHFEDAFY